MKALLMTVKSEDIFQNDKERFKFSKAYYVRVYEGP